MSNKITKAREFLNSYLRKNNTNLGEHSAVMALVEYLDENGVTTSVPTPVIETEEYKKLLEENEEFEFDLDFAQSELRVTKARITELEAEVAKLNTLAENTQAPTENTKPGRPKKAS